MKSSLRRISKILIILRFALLMGILLISLKLLPIKNSDFLPGLAALMTLCMSLELYCSKRRKSLDAEAFLAERQFSLMVQNSEDLIAISDANRVLKFINPAGRKILGLDNVANPDGINANQFYAPEFSQRMQNEVIPGVRKDGRWSGEFSYFNVKTKELIPVMMTILNLTDPEDGKHLGMAAVSRDIRERKTLEKKLDRFFSASLDLLAIANLEGYFVKLNPAFTEVLGFTEEELCAHPCTQFIHPDDIAKTMDQIANQVNGQAVLSFENRYRTKSGDYRWLSWKSFPDGDLTYGAARDITEQKKQQDLLEKLNEQSVAATKSKSEFLANMSHEIRTPINGVIGMTSLLLDSQLSDSQRDFAMNTMTSATSLLTVINDILDFSKIEAGKIELEILPFRLETLVEEMASSMAWAFKNKSVPFVVNCEKNRQANFKGDPGRIRQVLNNFLSNALKFTAEGFIELEVIAIESKSNATKFRFSVRDSGIGMSEVEQKKLFQAFSQADASTARRFGGTGLGLSISKRLVELMGGEIGVISDEGKGSTFWFTLTLEHSQTHIAEPKVETHITFTKFPNSNILIADDNFINQKILLAMLEKIGLKAQAVGNGNEVLSMLRERQFDLILMDCQMPELDGYETTRLIRASTSLARPQIPIIAMTANALKGDREKCIQSGMNDYASKPIDILDLSVLIEKWLEHVAQSKNSAA